MKKVTLTKTSDGHHKLNISTGRYELDATLFPDTSHLNAPYTWAFDIHLLEKFDSDLCVKPNECDYGEGSTTADGGFQVCPDCHSKDWIRDYWYGPAGNSLEEAITHTKEAFQDICKKNKAVFLGQLASVCWEVDGS